MACFVWLICRKKVIATTNETTTESVPMIPETDFPKLFPKKTLIKNPKKGVNSKTKAKLVSIAIYPFKFFKLSMLIDPIFLNIETNMASPTATSAAATAMEKNTNTCPCASWW